MIICLECDFGAEESLMQNKCISISVKDTWRENTKESESEPGLLQKKNTIFWLINKYKVIYNQHYICNFYRDKGTPTLGALSDHKVL